MGNHNMMIDPHVHLRDGLYQSHKETLSHGFAMAWKVGLSGVFEMPNTNPALTSAQTIMERFRAGEKSIQELKIPFFHGIFPGITADEKQIKEVVDIWKRLFPKIPGLKLFAGHSTGNMGIPDFTEQQFIYRMLVRQNYTGVLMVHCEKESILKPELFDPQNPETHLLARPAEAELESVRDQIALAEMEGFRGTLHICHISVPETLDLVEEKRKIVPFIITCGITPHHALLSVEDMKKADGILLRVNPPLRSEESRTKMFDSLLQGRITWIETDHAPHTLNEKKEKYYSGIPVLPIYKRFINILSRNGLSDNSIEDLTFRNIINTFSIPMDNFKKNPGGGPVLEKESEFDPFDSVRLKYNME